jgi:multiple sugar transport system substrate-binding protein
VTINWFVGLGGGTQPEQIPLEEAFVTKFNASHPDIRLKINIVDNANARDSLTALIASGQAPDIVGPVGTAGRAAFLGAFLDLEPLVKEFNYDIGDVDPAFLRFYTVDGRLEGLPLDIFPEAVYYNRQLFDKAGLKYPPQEVGQPYQLDGKTVDWTFDTLTALAKRLTLDRNGNNATSPNFDRNNIVQYGYYPQWVDGPRNVGTLFGAFYPLDTGSRVAIPNSAQAAWRWFYLGIWGNQPFIPNQDALNADLMGNTNAFSSGRLALATTHLWYTCCLDAGKVPSWDVAVMPSYNGKITAKMHADSFAILAASQHPQEAFKVYAYLLGEGSAELYKIYWGLPARRSQQGAFLKSLDERYSPNKVNWQVFLDMIPYMDIPNHELGLPNNGKAADLFTDLGADIRTLPNLVSQAAWDRSLETFRSTLQTTVDAGRK